MPDLRSQQGYQQQTSKLLDLLFIHDATGSQQQYIKATVSRCQDICFALRDSGQLENDRGLQLGLIAFRDHNEGDEFVTKDFGGFTYDVNAVVNNLASLVAFGGGDGPEAVAAALGAAMKFKWRPKAAKIVVLITDAPPHGIGERGDDYWDGEPDGKDPLFHARAMARRGIALMVVACENTLSNDYELAHDFYAALAKITSGKLMPLTNTDILAPLIVGFAFEHVKLDSLVREFQELIARRTREGKDAASINAELMAILKSRDEQVTSAHTDSVYNEPAEAEKNVEVWMKASNISDGRDELLGILAQPRVPAEFSPPPSPWPKNPVEVTLKNLGDDNIEFRYPEEGKVISGVLGPSEIGQARTFVLNTPYLFTLRLGNKSEPVSRTFTRIQDWDLARHFE